MRALFLILVACGGGASQQSVAAVTCPDGSTWSGSACVGTTVVRAPRPREAVAPPVSRPACETAEDCTTRCDAGEASACSALGVRYDEGNGVAKDTGKAKLLFERACAAKDPEGCYQLALGWGDPASKLANYETACVADHALACVNLGARFMEGTGVTADPVRGRALAEKACTLGASLGCANLGLYLWKGMGGPKEPERAATLSRQACDAGVASACARLGDMYGDGEGVAKDPALARKVYQRACDLAPKWCNDIGIAYWRGRGGDPDVRRAKQLFEKSCNADEPAACNNLGRIWRDGDVDDEVNFGEAADLFDKACKLGNSEGCTLLAKLADEAKLGCERDAKQCTNWGYMNEHGLGVPRSGRAAIEIYVRACTAKRPVACSNLGGIYRDGEIAPADTKKALQYFDRACKLNMDSACLDARALRAK